MKRLSLAMLVAVLAAAGALLLAHAGSGQSHGAQQRLIDPVHGVIGGVRVRETRAAAESLLGRGSLVKRTRERGGNGFYATELVHYAASGLDVYYLAPLSDPGGGRVFAVLTSDPRYRTADGLHVGSTLAAAQHERTLACSNLSPAMGYADCQGGLGYEKPVTNFQVRGGAVARVVAISVAD